MRKALVFEASRDGYGIDQIEEHAMTVGQLKEVLEQVDDDMIVVLSHDRGYTYGSLSEVAEIRKPQEGEYGVEYVPVDEIWL